MSFLERLSFLLLFLFLRHYTNVAGNAISVKNSDIGGLKTLNSFSDESESLNRNLQEEIFQELNHLSLRKQREIFEDLEKQEKELTKKSLALLEPDNLSPLNVEELKNVKKTIKTTNSTLPAIRNKRTLSFLLQAVARAMGYTLTPRNPDAEWIPRQRPQPPQQPTAASAPPCPTTPPPCRPASPSPPPCPMPPTTPPCPGSGSSALMQIPTIPPGQIDANTISYPYRPARTIPLLNFAPLPQGVSVPYPALLQRPTQPPCSPPQTPPPCGTTPAPTQPPCTTPAPSPPPCQTTPAPRPPPCGTTPAPRPPPCGTTPAPSPPPCGTTPAPRTPPPCGTTPAPTRPPCRPPAPSPPPCGTTPRPSPPPCQTTPAPPPPCGTTPAPSPPPCTTPAPRTPPPCTPPPQPSQPPCAPPTQAPAPAAPPCGAPPPPPSQKPSSPPQNPPPPPPPPPSDKPKKGSILLEYDDPVRIHIFSNDKKFLPASGSIYSGLDDGFEEDPHAYFFPKKQNKEKEDVEEEEEVEEEHVEAQEESDEEEPQKQEEENENEELAYYEREDEKSNQAEKQEAEEEEDESETNLSVVRKPVSKEIQKNHQRRLISLKAKNTYDKGDKNGKENTVMEEKTLEKTEKMAKIKKPKRKKWVRIVKKQRRKSKTDSSPQENYHIYSSDNSPDSSENLHQVYGRSPFRVSQIRNQEPNGQDTQTNTQVELKKITVNKKAVSSPEVVREVRRYEGSPRNYQLPENDEVRRKKLEQAVERYVEDYVEKQLGEELLKNTGVPKTTVFEFAPKNGPRIQTITRTVAKTSGNPSAFQSKFTPVTADPGSQIQPRGNPITPVRHYEESPRRRGIVHYEDFATRSKK